MKKNFDFFMGGEGKEKPRGYAMLTITVEQIKQIAAIKKM